MTNQCNRRCYGTNTKVLPRNLSFGIVQRKQHRTRWTSNNDQTETKQRGAKMN